MTDSVFRSQARSSEAAGAIAAATATAPVDITAARGRRLRRLALVAALGASALSSLSGCVLLAGGAVVGGTLMYTDRRTSGTQVEDEVIERKASSRAADVLGDKGHINVTSYNRLLLVTGEVPADADKDAVTAALKSIDNVASVDNELEIGFTTSITSRSQDTLITSKVKASFIDAKDIQAQAIKVVTEHQVVYLMGLVTEREAKRSADIAAGVSGVKKVVRVFQVLTDDELAKIQTR